MLFSIPSNSKIFFKIIIFISDNSGNSFKVLFSPITFYIQEKLEVLFFSKKVNDGYHKFYECEYFKLSYSEIGHSSL